MLPVVSATDRLRDALASSDEATLARWAATGPDGIDVLRRELSGPPSVEPSREGVHPRDVLDNLTAAIAAIAEAEPDAYLTAFAGEEWRSNGLVLVGLGRIDDPEATRRLAAGARAGDVNARIDAAMGLGRRPDPVATAALVRLLDDPDYLVRYHALRSLAAIGDASALVALDRGFWSTPIEADLARAARDAIERRSAEG